MANIPFLSRVDPANSRYVGAYIRYLRNRLDLTQIELAAESGYSVVTISRIENGKANAMGVAGKDLIDTLAELHGFEPGELYNDYCAFVRETGVIFEPLQ